MLTKIELDKLAMMSHTNFKGKKVHNSVMKNFLKVLS
jgi:hypothetical protein